MAGLVSGFTNSVGVLAGVITAGTVLVLAVRRFHHDKNWRDLLIALAGAVVAMFCGILLQAMIIDGFRPSVLRSKISVNSVIAAHFLGWVTALAGAGLGWTWSMVFEAPSRADPRRARTVALCGLDTGLALGSIVVALQFALRLVWNGHDSTVAGPGLTATFVFLLICVFVAASRLLQPVRADIKAELISLGLALAAAILLSLGIGIVLNAIIDIFEPMSQKMQAWNILIFLYPIVILGQLALGAALLFAAGKLALRWTRRLT